MKLLFSLFIYLIATSNCFSQSMLAQAKPAGGDDWGYIDPSGKFIIEPAFAICHTFSEDGYAPIYEKKKKSFYFIDKSGKELSTDLKTFKLKGIFGFGVKGFEDGMAMVQVDKKWGYLNLKGKLIIAAKYEKANHFVAGYASAKSGRTWVILNKEGVEIPIDMNGILEVRKFSEGFAPIKSNDLMFGFVNNAGKMVIEAKFRVVGHFVDGLAWAKTMEGMIGFIDKKGEWVIKPQFAGAKDFSKGSGFARVTKNKVKMFVTKEGKTVSLNDADSFGDFHEGLAYGKKNDLAGFFDTKGTWVIKPTFQAVKDFSNGYARAKQGDKWGFIDKTGKWVIEPQFDGIRDFVKVN